jgi:hypothetical protein
LKTVLTATALCLTLVLVLMLSLCIRLAEVPKPLLVDVVKEAHRQVADMRSVRSPRKRA